MNKFKVEMDTVVFYLLYVILFMMVIVKQEIIDIGYFLIFTVYLIRIWHCRHKKSINKQDKNMKKDQNSRISL